jgi:MGT family glycosyltransferase
MCIAAFQDSALHVVISLGSKVNSKALGPIPKHIVTAPHVPQLEQLAQSDVFITHGGTNSVVEALFYGVPMVVIPRTLEHSLFASCIVDLKLGVMLEKQQVSPQSLHNAVYTLLGNEEVKMNLNKMREEIIKEGGHRRAVEAINHYIAHHA